MGGIAGIEVISPVSHTLYDLYHLIKLNGGSPPLTYTSFQKLMGRAGLPPKPAGEAPNTLPPLPANAPALCDSSVPSLEELGYPPQATTVFKVMLQLCNLQLPPLSLSLLEGGNIGVCVASNQLTQDHSLEQLVWQIAWRQI